MRDKKIWTKQEDATLTKLCAQSYTYGDISLMMERPVNGIKRRVKHLKIKHPIYSVKGYVKAIATKAYVSPYPETYTLYGKGKSLNDVGRNECRWMVENLCCAAVGDDVYCDKHMEVRRGKA